MASPPVTLVTYTYNDAPLAQGLLRACGGWTLRPDRVVVVDDGSDEPFACTLEAPPVTIVRLTPNHGPAQAKAKGLSHVDEGVIVSLDCDIRPHEDWVRRAVESALDPGVGLVGAAIRWDAGDDAVGRYLRKFGGTDAVSNADGVLRGGAWVMRAQVWRDVGGFGEHGSRTHEDFVFSRRVAAAGQELVRRDEVPVRQVRRIGRLSLAGQKMEYVGRFLPKAAASRGLVEALAPLLATTSDRLGEMAGEPQFVYLELLSFTALLMRASNGGLEARPGLPLPASGLAGAVAVFLARFPLVQEQLRQDWESLGAVTVKSGAGQDPTGDFWLKILDVFAPCVHNGALGLLEQGSLKALVAEDAAEKDFHYVTR